MEQGYNDAFVFVNLLLKVFKGDIGEKGHGYRDLREERVILKDSGWEGGYMIISCNKIVKRVIKRSIYEGI